MYQDDELVSRTDARKHLFKRTAMQYYRYEEAGYLTPLKAGGARSARVYYLKAQFEQFLKARLPKPPPNDEA